MFSCHYFHRRRILVLAISERQFNGQSEEGGFAEFLCWSINRPFSIRIVGHLDHVILMV